MASLYRFEFDETSSVNVIVLRSDSFLNAIESVAIILGELCLRNALISIHKIN